MSVILVSAAEVAEMREWCADEVLTEQDRDDMRDWCADVFWDFDYCGTADVVVERAVAEHYVGGIVGFLIDGGVR